MDTIPIPRYACYYALLWTHVVVGASLLPPTNVTLQCHNMQNTLSWGYDGEATHGLKFKVFVASQASDPVTHWVDWPHMSIDLSKYSDPTNDGYLLMVSAVKEPVQSEQVPKDGIVYSYFQDSVADIKCSLDLPSVNVTTLEGNHLHFSFTHPGVLYPTSRTIRKRKSQEYQDSLPVFDYQIKVLNQKESHNYHCIERECQGNFHVHGSEKSYCLNISGEMQKMAVRATKEYCSEPLKPPGINPLAYIIPIVLVLVAAVVIGSMVFVKKTKPSTSSPTALVFSASSSQHENVASPVNSEYALPDVSSPSPLIPPAQNTSNDSSIFIDEVRLPLGLRDNDNGNEPEQEAAAGAQGASDDGYTGGSCLEGDEEEEEELEHSAYEQRAKFANPTEN